MSRTVRKLKESQKKLTSDVFAKNHLVCREKKKRKKIEWCRINMIQIKRFMKDFGFLGITRPSIYSNWKISFKSQSRSFFTWKHTRRKLVKQGKQFKKQRKDLRAVTRVCYDYSTTRSEFWSLIIGATNKQRKPSSPSSKCNLSIPGAAGNFILFYQ